MRAPCHRSSSGYKKRLIVLITLMKTVHQMTSAILPRGEFASADGTRDRRRGRRCRPVFQSVLFVFFQHGIFISGPPGRHPGTVD